MLAGASLEAEASSSTKKSVIFSSHSGRSRNGLPRAPSMSSFSLCFWFLSNLATCLPVLVAAALGVESSRIESCGTDVEDVRVDGLEGPVDNDRYVRLRVALYFPAVFYQDVVF